MISRFVASTLGGRVARRGPVVRRAIACPAKGGPHKEARNQGVNGGATRTAARIEPRPTHSADGPAVWPRGTSTAASPRAWPCSRNIHVHMYSLTYTHTNSHTQIPHIRRYTQTHSDVHMHKPTCTHTHAHMHIFTFAHTHAQPRNSPYYYRLITTFYYLTNCYYLLTTCHILRVHT